jgi:hypothetical protein
MPVVDRSVTTEELVLGTSAFMSPEHTRSPRHADAQRYLVLGAVLYQLIEGEARSRRTVCRLCLTITMDPPLPMDTCASTRARDRTVPRETPAHRFQNVGDSRARSCVHATSSKADAPRGSSAWCRRPDGRHRGAPTTTNRAIEKIRSARAAEDADHRKRGDAA